MIRKQMALAIALVAMACSSPGAPGSQELELRTDRTAYVHGDSVVLTLVNHGPEPVGPDYAALSCLLELERRSGLAWEAAGRPGGVCRLPGGAQLAAGDSLRRTLPVDEATFSGKDHYRFRTSQGTESVVLIEVVSNAFSVTSGS